MGFLESIFSYVFGDGDPNKELGAVRLSAAADAIRSNNGAVSAEQLAPFCEVSRRATRDESRDMATDIMANSTELTHSIQFLLARSVQLTTSTDSNLLDLSDERALVDESYVLPIVGALGGVPKVTNDGDIVYVFEELMKTGMNEGTSLKLLGLAGGVSTKELKAELEERGVNSVGALEKR